MNFDFSEDQKLLKEQVSKFLADNCNIDVVRDVLEGESSYSEVVWNGLVELGLTGTAIPEEYGGIGLGALELCVIAEEIGRAAAPVPFSSSVYLGTDAIVKYGTQSQKEKWLPKLASGEIISTFALPETNSEPTEKNIKTSILDGKINGKKIPVADGSYADIAIVVVRDASTENIALAITELNNSNVSRNQISTLDPSRDHAEIVFKDSDGELMDTGEEGWSAIERVLDSAAVLMAFEQIGGAEASLKMAIEYALDRYAFGRQIGSYQAIKHKLADMYVKIELARSNSFYGAMMLNDDGADLKIAAAASRVAATDAFNFAAQENVHTHGGIGFTWEADTQFFYRRSQVLGLALGSSLTWKNKLVNQLEEKNIS